MYRVAAVIAAGAVASDADRLQASLSEAYDAFYQNFPKEVYTQFLENFENNLQRYTTSAAYNEEIPNCIADELTEENAKALQQHKVSAFAGASTEHQLYGVDLVSKTLAQLMRAKGPASAQVAALGAASSAAMQQTKGILQTVAAVAATDIPPMIPPPVWNNQPFPCLPMVTGHNCAGAVLYPITIGDFIMADMTDSTLDAAVGSFPSLYREKVGKTDDQTYQQCFDAYMSMKCASSFPMCTTLQARQEETPFIGRGPMCFVHCIATLIACPGFWVQDILDSCQDISVPPVCALATYHKTAPSQVASYDESQGALRCPDYDADLDNGSGSGAGAAGGEGLAPAPTA